MAAVRFLLKQGEELAAKLKADDELEKLLGLKGAKRIGKHFIRVQKELEALDTDGDAKITFKEFAKLLEYVKPPQEPLAPVTATGPEAGEIAVEAPIVSLSPS